MGDDSELFVGLDVSKLKISVAVAEGAPGGEVRFYGDIDATPAAVAAMIKKLAKPGTRRGLRATSFIASTAAGHACTVVAPSLIPTRPGDRVKTNRKDALGLAKLHRAGELTAVWVPDRGHEAMRVSLHRDPDGLA